MSILLYIHCDMLDLSQEKGPIHYRRRSVMKGFYVANGYMGYVDGVYKLFASDAEYFEYMEEA